MNRPENGRMEEKVKNEQRVNGSIEYSGEGKRD